MNISDYVIFPDSKTGTSMRFKAKTARELQLKKVQLENEELEKKLQQLQANMSREKRERKRSSAYHWKSGQARPMTTQGQVLSHSIENNKVSSGKVKLQLVQEQIPEPMKELCKHEMANAVAHKKSEVKGVAHGLCEIKNALLTEADPQAGKLEVVGHFIKEVNLNEPKINHEQKKVKSKCQVTSEKLSSLLASAGSAEELSSEPPCTGLENQDKSLLLNGTFNEEESVKSFQEALLQWRKGNCHHREPPCASEALPGTVGICEVQTSCAVRKEPIQIEFKKGGLSYMEKLLLKKHRRTPVDHLISGSCVKDLRSVQTLTIHQAVPEGEGDDGDINDLTAEEVKRYWASVFQEEVPNPVPERADSSLKIEFLDNDLEESSNFLVLEAEAVGMNKQGEAEALKQCGRNPVSGKETPQGKMVGCSHPERNAVQKESVKKETLRRSLTSCELPEKISNPAELMNNKGFLETPLQETSKDSQELDNVCNSQSLASPVIPKSSGLQEIAKRQKSISTWYWGLEGFFVGVNPEQVMLEARSPLCADCSPVESRIPFPGDGKWVTKRSLSECADDSVVQGVLESQMSKPSSGLGTQKRISPRMVAWRSYPGNNFRRPWSTNMLPHKLTGNCPTNTQPRPKSSPLPMFRVVPEVSTPKCLDLTSQDEYLWEYVAEQEALLNLEKELQNDTSPEEWYRLTSEDVTSSSRLPEKVCGNTRDFHKHLELEDQSRADTLRGWDEGQVDEEEEILEDKQQVLALQ